MTKEDIKSIYCGAKYTKRDTDFLDKCLACFTKEQSGALLTADEKHKADLIRVFEDSTSYEDRKELLKKVFRATKMRPTTPNQKVPGVRKRELLYRQAVINTVLCEMENEFWEDGDFIFSTREQADNMIRGRGRKKSVLFDVLSYMNTDNGVVEDILSQKKFDKWGVNIFNEFLLRSYNDKYVLEVYLDTEYDFDSGENKRTIISRKEKSDILSSINDSKSPKKGYYTITSNNSELIDICETKLNTWSRQKLISLADNSTQNTSKEMLIASIVAKMHTFSRKELIEYVQENFKSLGLKRDYRVYRSHINEVGFPLRYMGKKADKLMYVIADICLNERVESFAECFGGSASVSSSLYWIKDRLYNELEFAVYNMVDIATNSYDSYIEILKNLQAHFNEGISYILKFEVKDNSKRQQVKSVKRKKKDKSEKEKINTINSAIKRASNKAFKNYLGYIDNKDNLDPSEEYVSIPYNGKEYYILKDKYEKEIKGNEKNIIRFFRVMGSAYTYLYYSLYGEREVKSIYVEDSEYDNLELAAYVTFIHTSFFNVKPSPSAFSVDNFIKMQDKIEDGSFKTFSNSMCGVVLRNEDYKYVLNNCIVDLLYLDPPYFRTAGYTKGFDDDDEHIKMINLIKSFNNKIIFSCKSSLTNEGDSSNIIKSFYNYFKLFQYDFEVNDGVLTFGKKNKKKYWVIMFDDTVFEIMITNFEPHIENNKNKYNAYLNNKPNKSKNNTPFTVIDYSTFLEMVAGMDKLESKYIKDLNRLEKGKLNISKDELKKKYIQDKISIRSEYFLNQV